MRLRASGLLSRSVVGLAAAVGLLLSTAVYGQAAPVAPVCTDTHIPVSLGQGAPSDQQLYGRLCLPAGGATPSAVQILLSGMTYNHNYWDAPDPVGHTDRYSYVDTAAAAGYATLAIDRLGTGESSKPLSVLGGWTATSAWTVHQAITALRSGSLGPAFGKVVEVGHSLGSSVVWLETSQYHDVDGVIITGATHHPNYPFVAQIAAGMYPAMLDPKFAGKISDPGYVTTRPNTRSQFFLDGGSYDPQVAGWDEQVKDMGNAAELAEAGQEFVAQPLDIRAPVFEALGQKDRVYCSDDPLVSSILLANQCANGAALVQSEKGSLGPHVPSVDGFVLANSGHDLNLMYDAKQWQDAAMAWIAKHVAPGTQ